MLQRTLSFSRTPPVIFAFLALAICLSFVSCAKRQHQQSASVIGSNSATLHQNEPERININTASEKALEQLPGIGKGLAERIVDHRGKYGPFRRPEHLIIVRGISDRRFRMLRDLITVE